MNQFFTPSDAWAWSCCSPPWRCSRPAPALWGRRGRRGRKALPELPDCQARRCVHGQQGADGFNGPSGPQGPQGSAGADGSDGSDGEDGADGTLVHNSGIGFQIIPPIMNYPEGRTRGKGVWFIGAGLEPGQPFTITVETGGLDAELSYLLRGERVANDAGGFILGMELRGDRQIGLPTLNEYGPVTVRLWNAQSTVAARDRAVGVVHRGYERPLVQRSRGRRNAQRSSHAGAHGRADGGAHGGAHGRADGGAHGRADGGGPRRSRLTPGLLPRPMGSP